MLRLPGMRRAEVKDLGDEGQDEMRAMETPLVFGGFSQETVDRFGDRFRAMGLTPVAGGRSGSDGSAARAAGTGNGGEPGAGAGGSVDGGDLYGDVCRPEAAPGVRASDYAVWAGTDADD